MSDDPAFENALKFANLLDAGKPWEDTKNLVAAEDSPILCQAEAGAGWKTVKDYVDWMYELGKGPLEGNFRYDSHVKCWDPVQKCACFFRTFHATHTGEGGPVPPTNKSMASDYVYFLYMNEAGKVARMHKVWNDGWALKQVGWA